MSVEEFDSRLARAGELLCVCGAGGGERGDADRRALATLAGGFGLSVLAQALVLAQLPDASRLLAPSAERIGWPFALLLVGAALASFPAALLIDAFGRRSAFALGASLGAAGGALTAFGVAHGHFPALCLGAFWLGLAQGFGLFYRHVAALGGALPAQGGLVVLAGGALAALAAPAITQLGEALGGGGAVLTIASGLYVLSLALAVRLPHAFASQPETPAASAFSPSFVTATLAGAAAWFVMAAAMLRGPLSLGLCSAAPSFIGGAMAWHLLAMYGPAALAARWPALFPPMPSLGLGLAVMGGAFWGMAATSSAFAIAAGMMAIGASWSLANIGALRLLHERGPVSRTALAAHDLCLLAAAAAGALAF
jgi:MFS family permease